MSRARGRDAEDRAAEFLLSIGYTLVTRRYAVRGGEIDLVALDGDELVFVEVRARKGRSAGPENSLSAEKAEHLQLAAEKFRREFGETERPFRFDLVAIDGEGLRHHVRLSRD